MVTLKEELQKQKYELERKKYLQKLVNDLIKDKIKGKKIAEILWTDQQVVSSLKNNIIDYSISPKKVEAFIEKLEL